MPSNEVKKKVEQIKMEKRAPTPADEELKKKANEILCSLHTVAKGELNKSINEKDIMYEINSRYNTNYQSDLPENVIQYLVNSGFILRGPPLPSKDSFALTALGKRTVEESSICD